MFTLYLRAIGWRTLYSLLFKNMIKTDYLVIGSGIAGLSFALKMADFCEVVVITKKEKAESNTNYAQSGIAAVLSPSDSFGKHVKDTLDCGDGLSEKDIVEKVVNEGPARIQELIELGVKFSHTVDGAFDLGMEGGHSKRRVVHVKDLTVKDVESTLLNAVAETPSIKLFENHTAINLVVKENFCLGCYALDTENSTVRNFVSKITVLASSIILLLNVVRSMLRSKRWCLETSPIRSMTRLPHSIILIFRPFAFRCVRCRGLLFRPQRLSFMILSGF